MPPHTGLGGFSPAWHRAAFQDTVQMASGSTPRLIRQGLSGELASEKILATGNCWNKKDECQTKVHGDLLQILKLSPGENRGQE